MHVYIQRDVTDSTISSTYNTYSFAFNIYECIHICMYVCIQGGKDTEDALSSQVIFRKRAL